MNNKNFQTFFDCGFSKLRASTFNIDNNKKACFFDILILTFFSSLTVYFDQKLLFVPILILLFFKLN